MTAPGAWFIVGLQKQKLNHRANRLHRISDSPVCLFSSNIPGTTADCSLAFPVADREIHCGPARGKEEREVRAITVSHPAPFSLPVLDKDWLARKSPTSVQLQYGAVTDVSTKYDKYCFAFCPACRLPGSPCRLINSINSLALHACRQN